MLGVDTEIGTSALRLWVTAGSAALLVVLCGLTFVLPTTRTAEAVRAILVAVGAVLGAAITWASFGGSSNASVERRALELRVAELTARTLAPGSPLACLDALAGEKVETACEKAIFASPESVASATSYVAARLALLTDITAYAGRNGATIDAVQPLRRALETDRFGFLAHVLAVRDGCTSENCKTLALLRDPSQVRTNLSEATFNHCFGVLFADLGQGVRASGRGSAAGPGSSTSGAGECVGPAQDRQHRLSDRGLDSGGQHHEPRADGTGPAGCRRRRCRQSERAVGSPGLVPPLAQSGRQCTRTGGRSSGRAGPASGGRTDLAGAAATAACRRPGDCRAAAGAGQSCAVCAGTRRKRRCSGARAMS